MRLILKHLLPALLILLPAIVLAQDFGLGDQSARSPLIRSSVLPAEEAFALSTFIEAPGTTVLLWEIREGYYLYRKSIAVSTADGRTITIGELPEGRQINDEYFGDVNVYYDRLVLRFPLDLLPTANDSAHFTLQYQGCAEDLYCYPMQMTDVELLLP